MSIDIYIQGKGIIAANGCEASLFEPNGLQKLNCVEPNYGDFFDNRTLRRMSRIIKLGATSAFMALKDANITQPDAIIVGTGFGCLEDTSMFLTKMINNKEELLNPTPFIFSTHNSISGILGILLQSNGYNNTFSHRNFAFESSLLDALILLYEEEIKVALVGAVDELTHDSFEILNKLGYYKGKTAGEGASFFILSSKKEEHSIAKLKAVKFYSNYSIDEMKINTTNFLIENGINKVDKLIIGSNKENIELADAAMIETLKMQDKTIFFKHFCGEFPSSSGFAFGVACSVIKKERLKNILIYNQYDDGNNHSFILLSAC